ncbi:hypothetical protein [Limimaricola pyoseonensis]|uniref:hypothetical protein n=1 Tax=Limimaricola pyoseonensis TaxID=521013 RepID=UPI000B7D99E5|nr:hypothetical protein [Limimaricola pyoseonensis]
MTLPLLIAAVYATIAALAVGATLREAARKGRARTPLCLLGCLACLFWLPLLLAAFTAQRSAPRYRRLIRG